MESGAELRGEIEPVEPRKARGAAGHLLATETQRPNAMPVAHVGNLDVTARGAFARAVAEPRATPSRKLEIERTVFDARILHAGTHVLPEGHHGCRRNQRAAGPREQRAPEELGVRLTVDRHLVRGALLLLFRRFGGPRAREPERREQQRLRAERKRRTPNEHAPSSTTRTPGLKTPAQPRARCRAVSWRGARIPG